MFSEELKDGSEKWTIDGKFNKVLNKSTIYLIFRFKPDAKLFSLELKYRSSFSVFETKTKVTGSLTPITTKVSM